MIQPAGHHLAQFNVARLRHPHDDPRSAGFVDNVARMNALAERSPGFVWRMLGTEEALRAADRRGPLGGDPLMTSTVSLWRSAADLEHFVFNTLHRRFYLQTREWFVQMESRALVLWWHPEGATPTMAEAVARLRRLDAEGDGDEAFGWRRLQDARLWMTKGRGGEEAARA